MNVGADTFGCLLCKECAKVFPMCNISNVQNKKFGFLIDMIYTQDATNLLNKHIETPIY